MPCLYKAAKGTLKCYKLYWYLETTLFGFKIGTLKMGLQVLVLLISVSVKCENIPLWCLENADNLLLHQIDHLTG